MKHRFRSLEIAIFSVVSLVFLNSAYNLLTNGQIIGIPRGWRSIGSTKPESRKTEVLERFLSYETRCLPKGEMIQTDASKIRISGAFCGSPQPKREVASSSESNESLPPVHPLRYSVENKTSNYVATVLSENEAGRFSTDFIPLENGPNNILMEFKYRGTKPLSYEITVNKK